MTLACILLAAGAGSRFGSNKLLHKIDGISMVERALSLHAALPYDIRLLVTRKEYQSVVSMAQRSGFTVLYNDMPERGMGRSAAIGAAYCEKHDVDGALFSVCDQPYLKKESVQALLDVFMRRSDCIAAAASRTRRGNPCVFPRTLFPELAELDGDAGGSSVIARHKELLYPVACFDERELIDLDTLPEENA